MPTRELAETKAGEVCGAVVEMDIESGWRIPEE
jgi:hypothetical protein